MRIIVFLKPTNKRGTKAQYTKYRQSLFKEGFYMMQPEVYMRIVPSYKSATSKINNITKEVPNTGIIKILTLTEKQYNNIITINEIDDQERIVGSKSLIFA